MMASVRRAKAETSDSERPSREPRLAPSADVPHAVLDGVREALARELAADRSACLAFVRGRVRS